MAFNRAERIKVQARVLLELPHRRAYVGNTVNVSESGVYFEIGYPAIQIDVEEIGLFHLMPLIMRAIMPCKVTRLTPEGIAVQFLDSPPPGLVSQLKPMTLPG
ncbi:MAG: PilZ domain-containing protein [Magnetococcales bacterium]|nr:PilZ domain-containing protein [Magnetococcales bacterium]